MKSVLLLFLASLLLLVASSSCKSHETVQTDFNLDSLQMVHKGYKTIFQSIEVNRVENMMAAIDSCIDSAVSVCEKKKMHISKEEATVFGRYQALKSGLKKFGIRYHNIKEELNHTDNQLIALKEALAKKRFDQEASAKYFSDECAAVKNVGQAVEQIHGASVYALENFNNYQAKVDSLISDFHKRGN